MENQKVKCYIDTEERFTRWLNSVLSIVYALPFEVCELIVYEWFLEVSAFDGSGIEKK